MRTIRSERLCVLIAAAVGVASQLFGRDSLMPAVAFAAAEARPLAHAIASNIVQLGFMVLPGMLLATAGLALYKRQKKQFFAAVLMLFALLAGPLIMSLRGPPAPAVDASGMAIPHSGEERLLADGRVVRLPDPRQGEGAPLKDDWAEHLWSSMSDAIQEGTEQVVLVFSRQGCPWCDRLVPVLQRAIQERSKATPVKGAVNVLSAPLRVFVFDAGEFPVLEQFQIEAFPTMLIFGSPGVAPRLVPGYLDDANFAEVLEEAATAEPDADVPEDDE